MTILTHPVFPVPIWGALQFRNHLLQHRWIATGEALDIETLVAGRRFGGLTGDYNGIHL
jgi:hypothetical protein